jgi:hypothetical protein
MSLRPAVAPPKDRLSAELVLYIWKPPANAERVPIMVPRTRPTRIFLLLLNMISPSLYCLVAFARLTPEISMNIAKSLDKTLLCWFYDYGKRAKGYSADLLS